MSFSMHQKFPKMVLLLLGLFFLFLTGNPSPVKAQDSADTVDLDVRDADLRSVLMELALKAKINLMLSPKIRGTITCRVKDIAPRELIDFIVRTNGYVLEDHGRILLVLAENMPGTNIRFEIIPLQNAKAQDVEKIIQTLKMDKRTKVTHDERTNRLIVMYEE